MLSSKIFSYFERRMSRSRYTLLNNSLIDSLILKKIRVNFRVYLEHAHPAFLTTLIVLVTLIVKLTVYMVHGKWCDRW